jgi:hypothetical protein
VRDARDVQAESHEQAAPDQKAGVVPGTP